MSQLSDRRPRAFCLGALVAFAIAAFPSIASAAPSCQTSGPAGGSYAVSVCLNQPAAGATLTGDTTVSGSASTATGTAPGVQRLVYYVDGTYVLTDYEAPYTFSLPTSSWVDGSHRIEVEALYRDGFVSQRAGVNVTFFNHVTTPPVNRNVFRPTSGTAPAPGKPFVLASTGDGAGGETSAQAVVDRIKSWSPNLFLYLGDVYEKGASTEFKNWYGAPASTLFGQFRSITDPIVGNHEYSASPTAAGYFDFWDNIPHYYSYNANGWHFIALDSTSQFAQTAAGSPQYNWLQQDLKHNNAACTIAYFHHPPFNIGSEGYTTRMDEMWNLMVQNGVALVLTGHDHDYQRWVPLDGNGNPPSGRFGGTGTTEFVVGTGGHSEQSFVATDTRVASAFSHTQFGALRMELNQSGAAYQFVTAAGQRLDSGSVQCPGTQRDGNAPTVPTTFKATAVSRAEIDLSWNQSNDNVGVTGYDIFRNGSLLKTIGPDTTFHDGTVAPGTTYTYTIRARDAANNVSQVSAPSAASTPALGLLFADGFESGAFTPQWKTNFGMALATNPVFSGSNSAHAVNTGGLSATWVTKQLASTQTNLYYQTRVYVASQGATPINLMRFRNNAATPLNLASIMRSANGKLSVRDETAGTTYTGGPLLTTGAWHTLQAHVRINGASSQVELWLDGAPAGTIASLTFPITTPIGWIDLGEPTKGRSYDVYFDEVAADTNPIPDVSAPSIPSSLSANARSGLQVDLSWSASTDDVGVTGYDIYRNGTLIASPAGTGTTFTDTTVQPQSSYFYQVRARDGASNASGLSDLATVTTPAVLSDGFESGDMSQWDPGATNISPQTGTGFSGSYAAHAVAFSSSAFATKTLPAAPSELYYRLRFKINNQAASNPINLLRFRNPGTATAVYTLSVSTSGTLAGRNDTTGVTTPSATRIVPGVWYEVQVHLLVSGVTGQVDVWLDGSPVGALSKADNFGTAGIGKLELGDSSALRNFDVLFDDVQVAANFIEDDSPPTPPGNVTTTSVAGNQVTLSWTTATDNIAVTSYDIYRDGLLIRNQPASNTTYTDTSVVPGTAYLYEVRANDQAGNTSDASNQVNVTTPGLDTTPPSKPTGLSATAVAANEVDLSWTGSTDDVAVTAYRIFRNGALMVTVPPGTTSYQDRGTSSDNTYTYAVEATDAAGNLSGQSDPASATTTHKAFFSDGFESGSLLPTWKVTGTVTDQQSTVASGAWAARATSTGSASWAWADLGSGQTDLSYSMRFNSASNWSGTTTLLKMRTSAASPVFGVQVSSAGKLQVRDDAAATPKTISSAVPVTPGGWHLLETHLTVAGTLSSYQVKLDGTPIPALSGTDDFGTAAVQRIQFADHSGGKSYDMYFDDIAVETPATTTPPANSTRPAITGTPADMETLTAADGSWSGSVPMVYAYQWRDCDPSGSSCTDISGATNKTYVLRPSDIGQKVAVNVTATNAVGVANATSNQTAAITAAAPTPLGLPTVTGAPVDGQQLSAATGTWKGTAPISYAYQWRRCNASGANCNDITTATAATYTLSSADVNSTIVVAVRASNAGGSGSASSVPSNVIGGVAPTSTSAPTISGTPNDGQTLSTTNGTWDGTTPISYAYQWQRCDAGGASCSNIGLATASNYTLTTADVGSTIAVNVTATNAGGSSSARSLVTGPVNSVGPVNTSRPGITGIAQDGQTLSADMGAWSGTTPISYAYQWQRCDSGGANCGAIASANNSAYTLAANDIGSTIAVRVTATNAVGSGNATSLATSVVGSAPPVNANAPSVTGAPVDGQQLNGSVGTWTGTAPISYGYQWQRCDSNGASCSDIGAATNATYTLAGADIGSTVRLVVRGSNVAGGANANSPTTNAIAAAGPANTTAPSISGTVQDGHTLTVDNGTWTGTTPIQYGYHWQRCAADGTNCSDVGSSTDPTYALTSADVGSTIAVSVTANNAGGSATAAAPTTSVVAGVVPANTTAPSILGATIDGQTLTADKGSWSGSTPIQYAYQWRDCDSTGSVCSDIAGATGSSYVLRSSDVSSRIVVAVTATNSAGNTTAASGATGAVTPTAPANGSAPTITGTAKVTLTLTANTGSWSGTTPIDYSYQWQGCASDGSGCSDLSGATGSTYVLVDNDLGHKLKVVVSAHNVAGTVTVGSDPTAVVQAADTAPANVAGPTIAGTAQDGQTLTADVGTWTGTAPIHYSYQWRDCDTNGLNCADIGGATNSSYTLRSSDVGSTVLSAVTGANDAASVAAASAPTLPVVGAAPANTTQPSVSGTAQVGSTLTGDKGSWSGTTPIGFAYQWQRCDSDGTNCADVAGATDTSYALTTGDFNHRLHLNVTASNTIGTGSATSSDTGTVVAAPANTSAPSISGTPSDGATLTANNGSWFGSAPINYSYQWQRCASDGTSCQDITAATSATYNVVPSDMGSSLRLQVTATNSVGTASAHSDATAAVSASAPANTSAPSISGTMREGSMLSADKGSWTGTDPITYAYQWRRCNSDGSGCSDVAGATDGTYVLSTADSGKAIEVRVTGTNDAGSSSVRSAQVLLRAPLFAEGFESGLTRWTNFGLTTQQADAFAGSWSAHAVSTGSPTYATASLPSAQSDLTYRLHFKGNTLTWPSTGVYLLKLRTAANASIVGVYADKLGRLSYRNDVGAIAVTSSTVLSPFDWHELAVHVTIAGTAGSIDMTLDGTHVPSFPKTENFGTGLVGKIQVGDNSSGRTFDVTSDEVIVDNGS